MIGKAAVVDTMVFAYSLLGIEPYREASVAVLASLEEVWAPDSVKAELVNVMWQWCTKGGVDPKIASEALNDAEALIDFAIPSNRLWQRALELAIEHQQSAYDTLFVALAERNALALLTYDKKLIRKFPDWAQTPESYLTARG